jgi:hypothetical protein
MQLSGPELVSSSAYRTSPLPATKLDGSSLAEIFAWVAGGTLGVGGAWQPAFLQGYDIRFRSLPSPSTPGGLGPTRKSVPR